MGFVKHAIQHVFHAVGSVLGIDDDKPSMPTLPTINDYPPIQAPTVPNAVPELENKSMSDKKRKKGIQSLTVNKTNNLGGNGGTGLNI